MNRVAALPADQRNELFALTAERRGLGSVAVVEKDFWVCWTLKQIFEHEELSKFFDYRAAYCGRCLLLLSYAEGISAAEGCNAGREEIKS